MALLSLASLGLVACGSDEVDTGGTSTAPSTSAPVSGAAALSGRTFLGTDVTVDGEPKVLVEPSQVRLSFDDDGGVGGSAGCNSLGGQPDADALDDGTIRIVGGVMMTEMACEPAALMEQDDWLADLLGEGLDWSLEGDVLVLTSGSTVLRLTDEEVATPDLPLEGTVWTVDGIIDGDTVSTAPDAVASTLVLHDDGTAELHTGCNTGSTTWTRDGDELVLRAIVTTRMACGGPAGELEDAVVSVLSADVLTLALDGSRLTLSTGDETGLDFTGSQLVERPTDATVVPDTSIAESPTIAS